MSIEPQLFRVNPDEKSSRKIAEADFSDLGLQERRDIQEWVVANPDILGEDLLIIAKEFSDFDNTNERLDLLAVDSDGKLVIIELKRDYSGADVHWQAIKYASYLRHATPQQVVGLLSAHEKIAETEAEEKLVQHVESTSLENLNSDQRIILVSHRFAREVTSAALFLNDKASGENLITCVQLIPHQDGDALFLQSHTIIPVPGTDPYLIQIGRSENDASSSGIRARRRTDNRNEEITDFVCKVEAKALDGLPDHLKTDARSRRAMGGSAQEKWYCMWYENRLPWGNAKFNYVLHVLTRKDGSYRVRVNFETYKSYLRGTLGFSNDDIGELSTLLRSLRDCDIQDDRAFLRPRETVAEDATSLDEELVEATANSLREMIEVFTEPVEEFVASRKNRP